METEGHGGEPVLVLTVVDVNENEEAGNVNVKSCVSSQIGRGVAAVKSRALEDNRSRVSPEGQPGKGYDVYAASNGRNVNTDTEHARAGNPVMLDLVADRLPGSRLTDGCVIATLCNTEHRLNGFTESSVRLTVGLDTTGSTGTVSCTDTAVLAHNREGNGMLLPPLDRVSEKGEDCARGENREFGGKPGEGADSKPALPSPVLSCTGKHRVNCTCACSSDVSDGKLSNGESDRGTDVDVSYRRLKGGSGVAEMKAANGGLHIVNTARATRDFETVHPAENKADVPFDAFEPEYGPKLPNIRSSSPTYRESDSQAAPSLDDDCTGEAVPSTGTQTPEEGGEAPYPEVLLENSAKLHSPCPSTLSANTGDSHVTEPGDFHGESTVTGPVRPLTLRTNPGIAVSLSCDATPLSPEDGDLFYGANTGCVDIGGTGRRQSAPDKLPDGSTEGSNHADQRMLSKKFGIADFFTRSLFSRKPKEPKPPSQSAPGWRLFGKAPPPQRDNDASKDPTTVQQEFQAKDGPQRPLSAGRRRNLDFEPLSTTALILEDRPANLPAKSEEEAQRHRQEYEEMVAGAKRRELREAQRRKRQLQERIRQEESIANAMVTWNTEILPHWETTRGTRRVRELWWQGLPPSVRGRVWGLAIGNELNITPELYEIFLSRAKEKWRSYSETSSENETEDCGASLADRESSLDLIKLDISRTFPSLFIFQKGGPYHDLLHSVLGAYTCYRPDIGYVQGMSFIAAVLILNLEEADTFITFANLLNKPCQMAFFRVDHDLMLKYFAAFEVFFEENLPRLFSHFQTNSLTPDLYLIDWIFTLYSKPLPLDVACRVWDVFCRDGEESLFRTGLGILRLYQDVLLQMDFIRMAQFLTRLPDDLAAHALFSCMAATHMLSGNRRWGQVFSALMKDGPKEVDKNNSPALRS